MKPILSVIAFATIVVFSSPHCKKEKISSVLPPITQEGKNTIGFKVNGQVWVPYFMCNIGANPCGEIDARYGPPNNFPQFFSFGATKKTSHVYSYISIVGNEPITTVGNKYDSVNIEYRTGNGSSLGTSYSKSPFTTTGVFEITRIDQFNQIISGIFSFKLYNVSGGLDSVEITEGRFDFKMNACICR